MELMAPQTTGENTVSVHGVSRFDQVQDRHSNLYFFFPSSNELVILVSLRGVTLSVVLLSRRRSYLNPPLPELPLTPFVSQNLWIHVVK